MENINFSRALRLQSQILRSLLSALNTSLSADWPMGIIQGFLLSFPLLSTASFSLSNLGSESK